MQRIVLKPSVEKAVIAAVAETAAKNAGEAMIYEMVNAARECIAELGVCTSYEDLVVTPSAALG